MNVQKAPVDDVKIRQAIAYAIDKQSLVEGILGGYDKPVSQLLSPAHVGWVEGIQGLPYDLPKAKAMIAAAGPKAKQPISLLTAPVYDQRVVQAIQQMLVEAGLSVKIEMTDFATWLKQMQSGPESIPQMAFSRWSCACQDADGIMFPILHSSSGWANAKDPESDRMLAAGRQTLDPKKRLDAYRGVNERLAKDLFVIPLYQVGIVYGASKDLLWQPTPNESMFLNRMGWKD
jgi:peptide/nickel transport system substrate-binding protein